jgi:glycosyltransferase EpsD
MKKVLFTATVQSHIYQFHIPTINMLKQKGYEIHVAAKNNLVERGLSLDMVDKVFDIPFARSPIKITNLKAYRKLNKIISENNYDYIHCNTPVGGIVTRLASKKARIAGTKVIYTAHGFHFYKGAPLLNWIIYYPIEKLMANCTDYLITITEEDYKLAIERGFETNIVHVHGVGVNNEKFVPVPQNEINKLRKQNKFDEQDFIVLCIGELNNNKNQSTILRAMPELIKKIPNMKLLLAGIGPNKEMLENLVKVNKLENHVVFLGYRTDINLFIGLCNIVVSASFREGLPLNIMEAMACSKPVIASRNRGHFELVKDKVTGLLVDADSIADFASSIEYMYLNKDYMDDFGKKGYNSIKPYIVSNVMNEIKNLYS